MIGIFCNRDEQVAGHIVYDDHSVQKIGRSTKTHGYFTCRNVGMAHMIYFYNLEMMGDLAREHAIGLNADDDF